MKYLLPVFVGYSALAVTMLNAQSVEALTKAAGQKTAGRKLFMRYCAECHGPEAHGTDRAPSLAAVGKIAAPKALQSFLKDGNLRRGMPSWSRLPDPQLMQLIAYLKSLDQSP